MQLQGETIDEVIDSLDRILAWAKEHKSKMGYFAALYRNVTLRVREGIRQDIFEDNTRMEQLDVIFANRYLNAVEQFMDERETTRAWKLAFDTTGKWSPIVFQHLLLGMNVHIQLDLGIAAVETMEPGSLYEMKNDFFKINDILASQIDKVQNELAEIWSAMSLIDRFGGRFDEGLANFGVKITRGKAWITAVELAEINGEKREPKIDQLDREVREYGQIILNQGFFMRTILMLIRLTELKSVPRIIEILESE